MVALQPEVELAVARIIAVDYGRKRCGIAVTDVLQIVPGGLATIATAEVFTFLCDYVSREEVERLVVGEPRQSDGSESENYARVMAFVRRWRKTKPTIPVTMVDERFTSVLAHRTIIDAGLRKKARQDKALVDEISATIILQSYLNSKQ